MNSREKMMPSLVAELHGQFEELSAEAEPESKGKASIKKATSSQRTIVLRASRATNTSQGGQNSVITDGQFSVVTATAVQILGSTSLYTLIALMKNTFFMMDAV
jgi:hypothetical protein